MKKLLLLFIITLPLNYLSAQWTLCNGTSGQNITKIVKVNNTLFAGVMNTTFAGRILKSTDNGMNWDSVNTGFILSGVFDVAVKGNTICFGTYERGLIYSTDTGITWQQNYVNGVNGNGIFNVGMSGNIIFTRSNTFIAPIYTMFHYSSNNGVSWNPLYLTPVEFVPNYFYDLDSLLIVGSQKGIVMSTNHGLNWTMPANLGLPLFPDGRKYIYSLYTNNGTIYGGSIHGYAYSTDMGNNWINTDMGFSDFCSFTDFKQANGFVFGSVSNPSGLTNAGVYKSVNNGTNWIPINSGLPSNPSVVSLLISNDLLFAGTDFDGIFKIPLSTVTTLSGMENGIIKDYSLEQNYPNPFNPSTKISFSVPASGFVSLKVFDVLGKEAYTIVNEVKSAGNYTADFNASNLSSGIYFYKLESGNFSKTMRMILIK
jgi:hypothetical protein